MANTAPSAPASYKAILKRYGESTHNVQGYFNVLPDLLKDSYPYEVSLAYLFLETEHAHNRALYCGVVKLHGADAEVSDQVANAQHLTRQGFLDLYAVIFARQLPTPLQETFATASKTRDLVIHGKEVSDSEMRQAHVEIIDYAEGVNNELRSLAGFEPFGDLRGFKGAAKSLEKGTTKWLLKGIGFTVS